jgi:hypothetical protein
MTQAKVYIKGSCYVSTTESNLCKECHIDIYEDYYSCRKIQEGHNNCKGIIWIKQQPVETQATTCTETEGEPEMNVAKNTTEEPKYTLAAFLEAHDAYINDNMIGYEEREEYIFKFLKRKNNPEYQEYLRLKAIFG